MHRGKGKQTGLEEDSRLGRKKGMQDLDPQSAEFYTQLKGMRFMCAPVL
jgi:hypothetical protein